MPPSCSEWTTVGCAPSIGSLIVTCSTRGQPPAEKDDVTFITLAVTPEQAQLVWLESEGKLTVSLRAFGDDKITDLKTLAEPVRIR